MTTIDEVARFAGVSVATVSRVLNGNGAVRPATAEKVQKAIRALNYVPNVAARNLRRNESRSVAVMVPNVTNPYYVHIFSGIYETARKLGYTAFLYSTGGMEMDRATFKNVFYRSHVDGMICLTCAYNAQWINGLEEKFPLVQCCEYVEDSTVPRAAIDNQQAAFDMVTRLIGLGHRRIAIMKADNLHISTLQRHRGYRQALEQAGLECREDYVALASADYSYQSGLAAAGKLLALPEPPTAIFCISDILALSAITAAKERHLSVPGDLSVTGMDDVDYTTMFHPFLTTVRQPCYQIGEKGMEMLYQFMQHFPEKPESVFLPYEVIQRESTGQLG